LNIKVVSEVFKTAFVCDLRGEEEEAKSDVGSFDSRGKDGS
jgi:hypothetical protein